ncbi:MAG: sialidase family protein [bacterium]
MEVDTRSFVICKQPGRYIGWPTVAQRPGGELLVVFSGDRDAHVCPFGKTQMVRSSDGGRTWSEPVTLHDTPLDDRDAGLLVTREGTVIVTWFTSLAFEERRAQRWKEQSAKISDEQRKRWIGNWARRSTDGGESWGDYIDSIVSAPHGPAQLSDGRLLFLGINKKVGSRHTPSPPPGQRIGAAESRDDGKTWRLIGFVPVPEGVGEGGFHEPHVVEAADGTLVGMIRHHGKPGDRVLWLTHSSDGGKTWSVARPTEIWGLPPHLIRLSDGRLLVTYGHRRKAFGQRACISRDGGKTWGYAHEIVIRDDAPNGDLGYPASVQLDERTILTVYYQIHERGEKTCLMGSFWTLPR